MNTKGEKGKMTLITATIEGSEECVNILLKTGADLNIADSCGRTSSASAYLFKAILSKLCLRENI